MLRILVRARVDPEDAPESSSVVLREFAAELRLARAAETEDNEASLGLTLIWYCPSRKSILEILQ